MQAGDRSGNGGETGKAGGEEGDSSSAKEGDQEPPRHRVRDMSSAFEKVSLRKGTRRKAVSFSMCTDKKRARTFSWGGEDEQVMLAAIASEIAAQDPSNGSPGSPGKMPRTRPKAVSFSFDGSMLCSRGFGERSLLGKAQPNVVHAKSGDLNMTPLMQAARDGNASLVSELLQAGADPGFTDKRGYDALMYAVRDGYANVCKLLLEAIRARVERQGQRGYTFHNKHRLSHMLYAAHNGHTACVATLAKFGSRLNMGDSIGCTPLMAAAQNNHLDTVLQLLHLGADVNAQDCKGLTALCWAVCHGFREVVQALIKHNADVQLCDFSGRSPLFFAVWKSQTKIAELLLASGAQICDKVRAAVVSMHMQKKREKEQVPVLDASPTSGIPLKNAARQERQLANDSARQLPHGLPLGKPQGLVSRRRVALAKTDECSMCEDDLDTKTDEGDKESP